MTTNLDRLTAALANSYRIDREIGQGGMATVYLAIDLKHNRRVAVKVLRPEIAASLGADRFTQEIEVSAALQHPHILPLLDSGEADGFLYYVMPFVEGESLRDRLARAGELPIHDAVRILSEVTDAIAAAHDKGVVHRDIKPDNVMLSGRHALVMDFGVAKAVSEATGRQNVTTLGVALGTPSYMAPEQAVADPALDHRVDIYAVGVMGYELLVGRPPFGGRNAQEILAAHVTEAPAPMAPRRSAIPEQLESVIMRCIEKRPADRWQTAEELLQQFELVATPSVGVTPTGTRPTAPIARRFVVPKVLGALMLVGLIVAAFLGPRDRTNNDGLVSTNPDLIAIFPFRVNSADSSQNYLGEGMVDLLSALYTGLGGPRAIDPRSSIAAWNQREGQGTADVVATSAARALGAGQYLLGGVVGTRERLVISSSIGRTGESGATQQARIEGSADSLSALLDALVGRLLALNTGLTSERTTGLPASLEAVRAYAQGRAANRRAAWDEAIRHFSRAVAADSSFTLAQVGMLEASRWILYPIPGIGRVEELAWANRSDLSPRDRALLEGYTGGNGPAPHHNAAELRVWEDAVRRFPDLGEAWYWLGEFYLHFGVLVGIDDTRSRAVQAFDRAITLDPGSNNPRVHAIEIAAEELDTARVERLVAEFLQIDSISGLSAAALFYRSLVRNDTTGIHHAIERFRDDVMQAAVTSQSLVRAGRDLQWIDPLFSVVDQAATSEERQFVAQWQTSVYLALGRLDPVAGNERVVGFVGDVLHVGFATVDTPTPDGLAALARLTELAQAPLSDSLLVRRDQYQAACLIALWKLSHESSSSVASLHDRLMHGVSAVDAVGVPEASQVCVLTIEAMVAVRDKAPDMVGKTRALDSLLHLAPPDIAEESILIVAHLYERLGRLEEAYAAAQKLSSTQLLPIAFREQGRLAVLLSRRDDAISAYESYLRIRPDPDPVFIPQRDSVRAELEALRSSLR